MLRRQHDDSLTGWHEIQLDPFHTEKADWRPVFDIVKHWHFDKGSRTAVWNMATINVKGLELEQADFLIFEQGFSEAQREAARLDREYLPGMPVATKEAA